MNEPILLGLGIIALFLIWHFIVRQTALGYFRDRLFDLRESIRDHYIKNGFSLEDKTYCELRLMINNQIRLLESASFTSMVIWEMAMDSDKDLRELVKQDLDERLATENNELAEYIKSVRIRAYRHTTGYILHASLGLAGVCYFLFPIVLICALIHASFKFSKRIIRDSLLALLQKVVSRDVVEGVSALKPV